MRRALGLLSIALLVSTACGRQPCEDGATEGPRVRLDVALGTCNATPIARITAPASVSKGGVVTVDASSSDDKNRDPLTYRWTLASMPVGSSALLAEPTAALTRFTADLPGRYELTLTVSDGDLTSAPATLAILARNNAPIADAGPDQLVDVGVNVTFDGTASSDPDGDRLTYAWSIIERPGGSVAELSGATAAEPQLLADARGIFVVALVVRDGELESEEDTMRIGAGVAGDPPIADAGEDQSVPLRRLVMLDGTASRDPDGAQITYSWRLTSRPGSSTAELELPTNPQPAFTPDLEGDYVVELIVNDGFYDSAPDSVTISASDNPVGGGTFDPMQIYLAGTLYEGSGGVELFCDIDTPNAPRAGFEGSLYPPRTLYVRPTDGAFIYHNDVNYDLRRFVPDGLPYDEETERYIYPENPLANDPIIPTPPCTGPDYMTGLVAFVVHPVTGDIFHRCATGEDWFDSNGNVVPICDPYQPGGTLDPPIVLGHDGSMLCDGSVRDANGVTSTTASSRFNDFAERSRPGGGFWVVRRNDEARFERWVIEPDGREWLDLTYGPLPDGYGLVNADVLGWANLDGEGRFYRWVLNLGDRTFDAIVQFEGTATGRVVYDEEEDPICKMHASWMVSGP